MDSQRCCSLNCCCPLVSTRCQCVSLAMRMPHLGSDLSVIIYIMRSKQLLFFYYIPHKSSLLYLNPTLMKPGPLISRPDSSASKAHPSYTNIVRQTSQVKQQTQRLSLPTYRPLQPSELPAAFNKYEKQTPSSLENDNSKRLFTFMDEHEAQRKLIQQFMTNKNCKNHRFSMQENIKQQCQTNVPKENIQKVIDRSRKQRQAFLKKLVINTASGKEKNHSKTSRNHAKTPRETTQQKMYETIQVRSKSKTPIIDKQRCITPRYDKQQQLGNKLEFDSIKCEKKIKNKQQMALITKEKKNKQNILLQQEQKSEQQRKQLLKKKKQLEKQLNAINESLLFCKKKQQTKKKGKVTSQLQSSKTGSSSQGRSSMHKLTKLL